MQSLLGLLPLPSWSPCFLLWPFLRGFSEPRRRCCLPAVAVLVAGMLPEMLVLRWVSIQNSLTPPSRSVHFTNVRSRIFFKFCKVLETKYQRNLHTKLNISYFLNLWLNLILCFFWKSETCDELDFPFVCAFSEFFNFYKVSRFNTSTLYLRKQIKLFFSFLRVYLFLQRYISHYFVLNQTKICQSCI